MRRSIAVVTVALVASACAPSAGARPGVAPSVHWAAAPKADVSQTEANLERDTGLTWARSNRDPQGRMVFVTVGASSAQAAKAHGWLCGFSWGDGAVLFPAGGGHKTCGTGSGGTSSGSDVVETVVGNVTWFTDSVVAFPKVSTNGNGCAHLTWPAGTRVRVTWGGKSAVCIVHDRGPAARTGNTLDLRQGQFRVFAPLSTGKLRGAVIERLGGAS